MDTKIENRVEETPKCNIIDENQIKEIAQRYLCIGGKWYKKSVDPVLGQEMLVPISPAMLIDTNGEEIEKDIRQKILKVAPKYLGRTNIPSHIGYSECIVNIQGDRYYNSYRPLKYKPQDGNWPHVEQLIRHIFGEQYEEGLDYLQLMYTKPLRHLPVLLLVSRETGTGKSTFWNFVREIFGENASPLTQDTLESRFTAPWISKLVVCVEETNTDDRNKVKTNEKLKTIALAEMLPSEGKGTNWVQTVTFVKIILCSNNEADPIRIDPEDTRIWARKIPKLPKGSPGVDFMDDLKKEIPAFLAFLLSREMHTRDSGRLWFDVVKLRTPAWHEIVNNSQSPLEKELREILLDIMYSTGLDSLDYDQTALIKLCEDLKLSKRLRCSITSSDISTILKRWGIQASKIACRIKYYLISEIGGQPILYEKVGKKVKIFKKNLYKSNNGVV